MQKGAGRPVAPRSFGDFKQADRHEAVSVNPNPLTVYGVAPQAGAHANG